MSTVSGLLVSCWKMLVIPDFKITWKNHPVHFSVVSFIEATNSKPCAENDGRVTFMQREGSPALRAKRRYIEDADYFKDSFEKLDIFQAL